MLFVHSKKGDISIELIMGNFYRVSTPAKTVIDFPETGRHNPSQTLESSEPLSCFSFLPSRWCDLLDSVTPNRRYQMKEYVRSLWNNQEDRTSRNMQ